MLPAALVGVAAFPASAFAAPKAFESVRAYCPGYGDTRLTSPGADGTFTPAFIEGTNQVLIPFVVSYELSGGGTTTDVVLTKPAAIPEGSITCDFSTGFLSDGIHYTITGQVTGAIHGGPN